MPERRPWRWPMVFLITAIAAVLVWYVALRTDPVAKEVDRLLAEIPSRSPDAVVEDLWALGPRVIPHLARRAGKENSFFQSIYKAWWPKLPKPARRLLPAPKQVSLRLQAFRAIDELGPVAARGAAPQVLRSITDLDQNVRRYAHRAVEWLAPESPEAVRVLQQIIAETNKSPFLMFDMIPSEYIWARTPGHHSIWTQWLAIPAHAYTAAIALGFMGSNAAPAIPLLIQTVYDGAADKGKDGRPDEEQLAHNRAMAAKALGAIGVTTSGVVAALEHAWNDPDPWVRVNAAEAVTMLGPSLTNLPPGLITNVLDYDNRALSQKCLAMGRFGPLARDALPILLKFTDEQQVRRRVGKPDEKVIGSRVEDIAAAAAMPFVESIRPRDASSCPQSPKRSEYGGSRLHFFGLSPNSPTKSSQPSSRCSMRRMPATASLTPPTSFSVTTLCTRKPWQCCKGTKRKGSCGNELLPVATSFSATATRMVCAR